MVGCAERGKALMKSLEGKEMKYYNVTKINIVTSEEANYGRLNEADMKIVIRGYHYNGLFYEKKNSNTMYIVEEIQEAE